MKRAQDIYFDNDANFYRFKGSKRKVSRYQLRRISVLEGRDARKRSEDLLESMLRLERSFENWQYETAIVLKDINLLQYKLGLGNNPNTLNFLELGRILRNTTYPKFRRLVRQIANGELSKAQIRARVNSYYRGSKLAFETGLKTNQQTSGMRFAKRHLGGCFNHCQPCIGYFQLGVVSIEDVVLPTVACDCRDNCCCSVSYGATAEELESS